MKVFIVDDDISFTNILQNDFESYFHDDFEKIEYVVKTDDFLNIDVKGIDVAFLDIDLEGVNGIELAKTLKKSNPSLKVIFVSAREELVFQALSVDVFQFIRKSQYQSDLFIVFDQLKQFFKNHLNRKIIYYQGRKTLIYVDKIEYILSLGHDVIIHLQDKDYEYKSSLKDILDFFDSPALVQIKRNLVINLYFVKEVSRNSVMLLNGVEYEVGRIFQEHLIEQYEEFLLR